jgi:hypothetical protein
MNESDALAVLKDLLEERNQSWIAKIVDKRGLLYETLLLLEVDSRRTPYSCRCPTFSRSGKVIHDVKCSLSILLLAIGGAEEVERQSLFAWRVAAIVNKQKNKMRELGADPTNPAVRQSNQRLQEELMRVFDVPDYEPIPGF